MTRDEEPAPQRPLARRAGVIGAATGMSRVLGLVREQVFAAYFGAGMAADAFNVAFRIPNLLRDLFAEGALSAAFVPTFTAVLSGSGRAEAFRLARKVGGVLILVVGTLCLLITLGAPWIVDVMAPGFEGVPGKTELTVGLTRVMAFFLLFVALAALAMGVANSLSHFFVPALAPAILNVGMILGVVLLGPILVHWGMPLILGMALGAMLGGLGQFLVQLPVLRREGMEIRPELQLSDPGVRRVISLMVPATFGLAAVQVNIFVNTVLASLLTEGSVSWLNYGIRLWHLPLGLFGVAVATATLPSFSRLAAEKDLAGLRSALDEALRLVLMLVMPAAAILAVLAVPVVALLFQHGRFDSGDTLATAMALQAYCVGLFAAACVKVLVPVFYALGKPSIPVRISAVSVVVNLVLNLSLMGPLGHVGLALGTALTTCVNVALLLQALEAHVPGPRPPLKDTLQVCLAVGVLSLVCFGGLKLVGLPVAATVVRRLLAVAVPGVAGVAAYMAVLGFLGAPEMRALLRRGSEAG